jgi:hypothetical protein
LIADELDAASITPRQREQDLSGIMAPHKISDGIDNPSVWRQTPWRIIIFPAQCKAVDLTCAKKGQQISGLQGGDFIEIADHDNVATSDRSFWYLSSQRNPGELAHSE